MSVYFEKGRHTAPAYTFTENLISGGFHRMKDFDIALHEIAWETGYDYNYLNEAFNDYDDDEDYIERIICISDCAIERDL